MTFKTNDTSPVRPNVLQSASLIVGQQQEQDVPSFSKTGCNWHKLLLREYESMLSVSPSATDSINGGSGSVPNSAWKTMNQINDSRIFKPEDAWSSIKPEPWIEGARSSDFPKDPLSLAWDSVRERRPSCLGSLRPIVERLTAESHLKMCNFVLDNFNDQVLGKALEFLERSGSAERVSYRQFRALRKSLAAHLRLSIFDRHFVPRRFLLYPRSDKAYVDSSLIEQYLVSQGKISNALQYELELIWV